MRNLTIIIVALLLTSSAYGFFGEKKDFYILDRQLTQTAAAKAEVFGQVIYDRYVEGGGNLSFEAIGNWSSKNVITLNTTDVYNKSYYIIYPLEIGGLSVFFCSSDYVNPFSSTARHGFAIENGNYEDLCAAINGQFQVKRTSSNIQPNGLQMNLLGNGANLVRTSYNQGGSAQMTPASYSPAAEQTEVSQSRGSKVMNFLNSFFSVFRGLKRNQTPEPTTKLPLFVSLRS